RFVVPGFVLCRHRLALHGPPVHAAVDGVTVELRPCGVGLGLLGEDDDGVLVRALVPRGNDIDDIAHGSPPPILKSLACRTPCRCPFRLGTTRSEAIVPHAWITGIGTR